jgi:hypothetical protein
VQGRGDGRAHDFRDHRDHVPSTIAGSPTPLTASMSFAGKTCRKRPGCLGSE